MIYVFKTSVTNQKQVKQLTPMLNKFLTNAKWNFDLDDCDNILRIDSSINVLEIAPKILHSNGFDCEELED